MSIGSGVIVTVALHEIDSSPDAETGSECDNKSLKYCNCAVTAMITMPSNEEAPQTNVATDNYSYFTAEEIVGPAPAEIDTRISEVLIEKGYTVEHATAIQEILNTIGIESIAIENMTGKPEEGVNCVISFPNGYTARDRRFNFTTEDGVLFWAGFLDEDLYDTDQGGYIQNYSDVHVPEKDVTSAEFAALITHAEPAIKAYLNYPDTANFKQLSYRVGRSDNLYQLSGSVQAQNGFGVKDTINFSVRFEKDGTKFQITAIVMYGVRVY